MTLNELQRAVDAEVATGNVGVPVSVRLNVVARPEDGDASTLLERVRTLPDRLFDGPPTRTSRREQPGQLIAMSEYAGGQTAMIVIAHGEERACDLIVVGNHGVIRLEGGELLEALT